jgi:hypothetical protein
MRKQVPRRITYPLPPADTSHTPPSLTNKTSFPFVAWKEIIELCVLTLLSRAATRSNKRVS